ncbi:MAG: hypothetical protein ABSE41_07160 [Bacteroidota bacterium]|jgi:hypothetical protein
MAKDHLVFRKSNPSTPPTLPDPPSTNHLKLITKNHQLELFDLPSRPAIESASRKIWAFTANLDQLALLHSREDAVLGFYGVVQSLFRALSNSDSEILRESHFMIWADGSPTYITPRNGGKSRPFWTFHLFGTPISDELGDFVSTFLSERIGWRAVGWVDRFSPDTFPMFEYRHREPIVFFTKLIHPNGEESLGYPEIFYRGEEVFLGFGSIPEVMKYAFLAEDFERPLKFTVKLMDEVGPEYVINVSSNLTVHPCGLTEHQLIDRCHDWDVYTQTDKELVRKYGPPT